MAQVDGSLADNAAANAAARRRAQLESMPQWPEVMIARVVLTSERFKVSVQGGWISLWAGAVVEFLLAPEEFSLIMTFNALRAPPPARAQASPGRRWPSPACCANPTSSCTSPAGSDGFPLGRGWASG